MRDYEFKDVDEVIVEDEDASYAVQELINSRKSKKSSTENEPKEEKVEEPVKTETAKEPKSEKVSEEQKKEPEKEPEPKKEEPVAVTETPKKKVVSETKATKKKVKKKTTKKKTPKKTEPTSAKKDDPKNTWAMIAITAIAVALIIFLIYQFAYTSPEETESQEDTVAALVNGVPIYNSDIDFRLSFMQTTLNPLATRDDALDDAITEQLLLTKAEEEGFSLSEKEAGQKLEELLESSGTSIEEFSSEIEASGFDYTRVLDFYRTRFIVLDYVNDSIVSKSLVSEDEIEDYYEANQEQFRIPERVQVRHILIEFGNKTDEEALDDAEFIRSGIKVDKSNFCDLVKDHSSDIGSIDTCGEYNFSEQDPFVPEFLEAGFDMEPDEIRIVKTQFGYHIMYKVADLEGRILDLDEVRDGINQFLEQQQSVEEYDELINELKDNAIIEIYGTEKNVTIEEESEPAILPLTDEDEIVEVVEETAEEIVEEIPVKEVVVTEESTKVSLAKCLADKDAKMYQVYWCPECLEQVDLFGDDASMIQVVECDSDGENAKPEECSEAGISTYPTWIIDGETYTGSYSLTRLAMISGCELE